MKSKFKIIFTAIPILTIYSPLCYFCTATQHILDTLNPNLFVVFTSTFKFYYPVHCFYSKISLLFAAVFLLPSSPSWDVSTDSSDYICHFRPYLNMVDRVNGKNKQVLRIRVSLHFFFFVNVPAICLLFSLATTCHKCLSDKYCKIATQANNYASSDIETGSVLL